MLYKSFILFFTSFFGGLSIFFIPSLKDRLFKYILTFSGSYLFGITILHILPDLFSNYTKLVGIFTIIGFFLHMILELFSGGVEHGHLYDKNQSTCVSSETQNISAITLLITLFIHGLLDSVVLVNPEHSHHNHHHHDLLLGIILHKVPAAFAFAAILIKLKKSKLNILINLAIFSLASPIGLYLTNFIVSNFTSNVFIALWGIAAGSFLNISTTIFFESNPHHHIVEKKQAIALILGIICSFLTEICH